MVAGSSSSVFFNEFHYDNSGTDAGEFIEIANPLGIDLTGWTVVLYNGSGGVTYGPVIALSGTAKFFVASLPANGLQNGSPDGFALIDPMGAVVQFLSYEGSFLATNGPATGLMSTDIGVSEPDTTPLGFSLQLTGTGTTYGDFTWSAAAASTSGGANTGQVFPSAAQPGQLSISDASIAEGNGGTTDVVFTVSRANGTDGAVSATWTVVLDGTADASDIAGGTSGTVSFAAGQTTATVTVGIVGDTAFEPNETFSVVLSAPSGGATISDGTGLGTILNDDAAPPSLGAGSIVFVGMNTAGGPDDWIAFAALQDIAPGAVIYFTDNELATAGATAFNTGESYSKWTAPAGGVAAGTVVKITNWDLAGGPVANVGAASAVTFAGSSNRGLSQTADSLYAYTAASDATADTPLQHIAYINFGNAVDGAAPAGLSTDFAFSLTGGQDSGYYSGARNDQTSFAAYAPATDNSSNWALVNGATSSAAVSSTPFTLAAPAAQTITIAAGQVALSELNDGQTQAFTFTVTRSGGTTGQLDFTAVFNPGGTTAGDFAGGAFPTVSGSIQAGQAQATVVVLVSGDLVPEYDETFSITLTGGSNASAPVSLGATTTASSTILNDDANTTTAIYGELPSLAGSATTPIATDVIQLVRISSIGGQGGAGAESVSYDPASGRLFVTNPVAGSIDVFKINADGTLGVSGAIPLTGQPGYSGVNSVAVKNGVVAVAYQGPDGQPGHVQLYDSATLTLQKDLLVGVLPDQLTFTPDGTRILVANEAEALSPTNNPAGSISVIDLTGGAAGASVVNTVTFAGIDVAALKAAGVSILETQGLADIEPEYIAVSPDGTRAYVTLQEVNAVAVIDLTSNSSVPLAIQALGAVDHNLAGNAFDPSDRDNGSGGPAINIVNVDVLSLLQPDAIASFEVGGYTYFITANEGDARVPDDTFGDVVRLKDAVLDPVLFPNAAALQADSALGRLNINMVSSDTDGDGDVDQIVSIGGRGFSIFRQEADGTITKVRESGGEFEAIIARDAPTLFNSNQNASGSNFDSRSDDKGPEPEGVVTGVVNIYGVDHTYAFIALERVGGIMVYDVTDPANASFVSFIPETAQDLGPETLTFIAADQSPTGTALVVSANEVSGTTTVYQINAPASPPPPVTVFINEIHYDNAGTDAGEAIEIAGPAGTNLAGWSLVLYNGTNTPSAAPSYRTIPLSGVIPNQDDGYGTLDFDALGLQNGDKDGIALVNASGKVVQFLSYEGTLTAANGPAAGMTSTDIGVFEDGGTALGLSLQLTGTGAEYSDFAWSTPIGETGGAVNTWQDFVAANPNGSLYAGSASTIEGDSGATEMVFLVRRAGGTSGTVTVDWAVQFIGGAQGADASDFASATSGTVQFEPGQLYAPVRVFVQGDTLPEPTEFFNLVLSNPTGGADIRGATGRGTIVNDEALDLLIGQIQGVSHTSPYVDNVVTTRGIVTAVASNGFYLQDAGDGDSATSDAIFVFTRTAPTVVAGDAATVQGTVTEFLPGGDPSSLTITELTNPIVTVTSSGNPLPAAVLIGPDGITPPTEIIEDDAFATFDPATDGLDFWESLEGMRVTVEKPVAVDSTNSFGELWTVASNGAGTYSASNVAASGLVTIKGGAGSLGTFNTGVGSDFNPERIQFDDALLNGNIQAIPVVTPGTVLNDVTGILDYGFGNYEVRVTDPISVAAASTNFAESTILTGSANQLTIASYNVLNLDINDGDGDMDVASGRFAAVAHDIGVNLSAPDIVVLEEIQDDSGSANDGTVSSNLTLKALADAIFAETGVRYSWLDNPFVQDGENGGQPGGNIRVAFLYRDDRVDFVEGSVFTITDPANGQLAAAFQGSRAPLGAEFRFNGESVTVIGNHFTSKIGSDTTFSANQPPTNAGALTRAAQAAAVNAFVDTLVQANPAANVVVAGDFNEFQFEEPMKVLTGELDYAAGQTTPGSNQVLGNLSYLLASEERYSTLFEGNAQQIDHILASETLFASAAFDIVHTNTPLGSTTSDHDPVLGRFNLGFQTIAGGNGAETLTGNDGNDVITGGNGNDVIRGNGGNDSLFGENGNDRLYGGAGDDMLDGGQGDDTLDGGKGHDMLTGGKGNDIFVLHVDGTAADADVIKDFGAKSAGNDTIRIADAGGRVIAFVQSGADTLIVADGVLVATVLNATAAKVQAAAVYDGTPASAGTGPAALLAEASFDLAWSPLDWGAQHTMPFAIEKVAATDLFAHREPMPELSAMDHVGGALFDKQPWLVHAIGMEALL